MLTDDDKTDGRLPPELEAVYDRLLKRLDDIGATVLSRPEAVSLRMKRMAIRHALDDAWHAGRSDMRAEAVALFERAFGRAGDGDDGDNPDAGPDSTLERFQPYGSM